MSIKKRNGQSLIEFIMILPILIGFWAAMVWFAQIFIIQIELLHTARHGVFWLAYQTDRGMSSDEETRQVTAECTYFLKAQFGAVNVEFGFWKALPMFQLLENSPADKFAGRKILKKFAGVDPNAKPASVLLTYTLDAPPVLRTIPGFPPTFPLRGYSVCYR